MQKKNTKLNTEIVFLPTEKVVSKIFLIRGKKIMLDRDLAELYKVETRALNQAVKRNPNRFPSDFMFQLTKEETKKLISQNVISTSSSQIATSSWGGTRKPSMVFTEQGVAMLSSVLNSERAILVNIQIIRTFTKLRELISTNVKLRKKIEEMEKKYDSKFKKVFDVLKQLLMQEEKPKSRIGFRQ